MRPDGWLGVLAVIAAIALLADLAVERLSPQTQLPMIGGSRAKTRLALAGITAALVVLKFLFHIHFSLFGFGFWAAVVLTVGLVFSALRVSQGQAIVPWDDAVLSAGCRSIIAAAPPPAAHRRRREWAAGRGGADVGTRPRARRTRCHLGQRRAAPASTARPPRRRRCCTEQNAPQ